MPSQKYLVTARKYRPQTFQELVAQEHVSGTLKNALRLDRLAHAYLFSGPRGVGKTTAARILAKAINCTTPLEERADGAEPCRTCDSCRSFEEGRNLNIFEIDAASHNKVEDVRDLRETVRIPPQGGRKKVYIVDEVHMLSNAAFNALLKTLEEPPSHVLFIFATTEPHKVLPTILSRCQRFDFRRIPLPETVARLETICAEESITADEAALLLIARKGDGALRDALSVFDQAVALCGTDLVYAELAQALGVVDVDLFFEVTTHVAGRDSAGMLRLVDRVVHAGYDLQEFLTGLAEHLRNLLVARTMDDTSLIEGTQATRQRYAAAAAAFAEPDLLRLIALASDAEDQVKTTTQPRLKLELSLLKMASLARAADLRQALEQLDRLEQMARDGHLPAASTPTSTPRPRETPSTPTPASKPTAEKPAVSTPQAPEPAAEKPAAEKPKPSQVVVEEPSPPRPESASDRDEPPSQEPPEPPAPSPSPSPAPSAVPDPSDRPQPEPQYPDLFGAPALKRRKPSDAGSSAAAGSESAAASGDGATATLTAPEIAAAPHPAVRRLEAAWPRCIEAVKAERIHVAALLQHTAPMTLQTGTLILSVPDDFHQRLLSNQHDFLLRHARSTLDEAIERLQLVIRQEAAAHDEPETAREFDPYEYFQRKRQEDPVLRAIFDQFGGEMVW